MSIEAAIYSRASGHAGLSALVSSRIYPMGEVPQNPVLPFVAWRRISTQRQWAGGSDAAVVSARFQFDAVAASFIECRLLAAQIDAAFRRWRGTLAGTTVQDSLFETEIDLHEPDAGLSGEFHTAIDYRIFYEG